MGTQTQIDTIHNRIMHISIFSNTELHTYTDTPRQIYIYIEKTKSHMSQININKHTNT